MKTKRRGKAPVTKPLIKKLTDQHKANSKNPKQNPTVAPDPLQPAELDQNSGGSYNRDDTFPQA
jgi:hypothetical protein